MKIIGIIPARYGSTRFPGKPLAMIHDKTMIQRVYEQALQCTSLARVMVATDDERIMTAVKDFGGNAMMTSPDHQSGTERCAEVISKLNESFDAVINIQGDEPFIEAEQISMLCKTLTNKEVDIATLIKKISSNEELHNANVVKVVTRQNGEALFFSRSAIPHFRGVNESHWASMGNYFKHLGIYAYRTDVLKQIVALPPAELEHAESLEQLRWLVNGFHIQTIETDIESLSIDTPADLEHAAKFINSN